MKIDYEICSTRLKTLESEKDEWKLFVSQIKQEVKFLRNGFSMTSDHVENLNSKIKVLATK